MNKVIAAKFDAVIDEGRVNVEDSAHQMIQEIHKKTMDQWDATATAAAAAAAAVDTTAQKSNHKRAASKKEPMKLTKRRKTVTHLLLITRSSKCTIAPFGASFVKCPMNSTLTTPSAE